MARGKLGGAQSGGKWSCQGPEWILAVQSWSWGGREPPALEDAVVVATREERWRE